MHIDNEFNEIAEIWFGSSSQLLWGNKNRIPLNSPDSSCVFLL